VLRFGRASIGAPFAKKPIAAFDTPVVAGSALGAMNLPDQTESDHFRAQAGIGAYGVSASSGLAFSCGLRQV